MSEQLLLLGAVGLLGLGGFLSLGSGVDHAIAGDAKTPAPRTIPAAQAPMVTSQQAAMNLDSLLRAARYAPTTEHVAAVEHVVLHGAALDLSHFASNESGRFTHAMLAEFEEGIAKLQPTSPVRASLHSALGNGMAGKTDAAVASLGNAYADLGKPTRLAHFGAQFIVRFSGDAHERIVALLREHFPNETFDEMDVLQATPSRTPYLGTKPPPYVPPVDVRATELEALQERAKTLLVDWFSGFDTALVDELRSRVVWPFDNPDGGFLHGAPKGVLVTGPAGVGKTRLAKQLATRLAGDHVKVISGPEMVSKWLGATEEHIRGLITEANEAADSGIPVAIVLDAMDSFVHVASDTSMDWVHSVAMQLETQLDNLHRGVIVIGTTSDPARIPPSLRQGGRFGVELSVGMPSDTARKAVLSNLLAKMKLADDVALDDLVARTAGYNMNDLDDVLRAAEQNAVRDLVASGKSPADGGIVITKAHVDAALRDVVPSLLRQNTVKFNRSVTFDDVGGMEAQIEILRDKILRPLKDQEKYRKFVDETPRPEGTLFFGPPGTGKTLLANALANEGGINPVGIHASDLKTAADVKALFERCRQLQPCLIFIDEIDSVLRVRTGGHGDAVVNEFLTQMNGLADKDARIAVVGTTNRLTDIDPAILRPERLGNHVFVDMPNDTQRRAILGVHGRKMRIAPELLDEIAANTRDYNGADLKKVLQSAVEYMVKHEPDAETVSQAAVTRALEKVKPSVSEEALRAYRRLNDPKGSQIGFTNRR